MPSRIMEVRFAAAEELVGGILADLSGRVRSVEYNVIELRDGRSKPRRKASPKRKGKNGDTAARLWRLLSKPKSVAALKKALQMTDSGVYYTLNKLRREHKVKKNAGGEWVRA